MGLDSVDTIDAISDRPASNAVVLTIADAWEWTCDETQHLDRLVEKLNAYLHFIETGQLVHSRPSAKGRLVVVDVYFRFTPPPSALRVLDSLREASDGLIAQVNWEVIPGD